MNLFDEHYDSYKDQVANAIKFSGKGHDFYTKVKAQQLKALLDAIYPDSASLRILDLGCGIGITLAALKDEFRNLTGADVSSESLSEAQRRNPEMKFAKLQGDKLPFPDASFDVVYCFCVMHHVPPENWPAFVTEMKRVLAPNGVVVIAEHNPWNPLTRYVVSKIPFDADAVLLPPSKPRKLFGRDFKSKLSYILFFPFDSWIFRKIESWLAWFPLGAQYFISFRSKA